MEGKDGARFFPVKGTMTMGTNWNIEGFIFTSENTFVLRARVTALEQVTQRVCVVSILEDIKKSPGPGPGPCPGPGPVQPALGYPAWAEVLGQVTSKVSSNFNHSVILWLLSTIRVSHSKVLRYSERSLAKT